MLIQNQIQDMPRHFEAVVGELSQSDEVLMAVAYVREPGVDMILRQLNGKPAKLLCSFDMGITQIEGIRKLLQAGVEIRVYKTNNGTFHPKIWLFGNGGKWRMIIGSANLTAAALTNNVEASILVEDGKITEQTRKFFDYLWKSDNSSIVDLSDIVRISTQISRRRAPVPPSVDDRAKTRTLLDFIKSWIDIRKSKREDIGALWRGWYIIPDHGYVNNKLMENMALYIQQIGDGVVISPSSTDPRYIKLLDVFMRKSNFSRRELKLSPHHLFVRMAKNYLIKFGWAYHPIVQKRDGYTINKQILKPTDLGQRIAACDAIEEIKKLYSEYFEEYSYNGLKIVQFTRRLLEHLEYLDMEEFHYFVIHAYSEDDFQLIFNLISMYRECENKSLLHAKARQYFDRTKELTGHNVYGNYVKNAKHTMSVIAWCRGFQISDDFVISRDSNAN